MTEETRAEIEKLFNACQLEIQRLFQKTVNLIYDDLIESKGGKE